MITNNKLQASRKLIFSLAIGTIFFLLLLMIPIILLSRNNGSNQNTNSDNPLIPANSIQPANQGPTSYQAINTEKIDTNIYDKKTPDSNTRVVEHYIEKGYNRTIDPNSNNNYYYEKIVGDKKKWIGVSVDINTNKLTFEQYLTRHIARQQVPMLKSERGEIRKYNAYKIVYINFNKTRAIETYIIESPEIPYENNPDIPPAAFHILSVAHSIGPLDKLDQYADPNLVLDQTVVDNTFKEVDAELNNLVNTYKFEEVLTN